jgi:hypothetical protein
MEKRSAIILNSCGGIFGFARKSPSPCNRSSVHIHMRHCLAQRVSTSPSTRHILRSCERTRLSLTQSHTKRRVHIHRRHGENYLSSRPVVQASPSSYALILGLALGGAFIYSYSIGEARDTPTHGQSNQIFAPFETDSTDPFRLDMPQPAGHLGNLTADQEAKLRDFWAATLRVFGVEDPQHNDAPHHEDATSEVDPTGKEKGKKRFGVFKRHKDKESGSGASTPTKDGNTDDKYGQVKEFQEILATQSPESLREAFWSMVKADHPDALLLRFLRARKWDVDKALVMLVSTMKWRSQEQHVDDDVVLRGEGGALEDSKSSDPAVRREGEDFLAQLRLGKSFLHGTDKEGRPLCFVRVRLHRGGEQTEKSLERYTVYVIETARLALRPPVETAVSACHH